MFTITMHCETHNDDEFGSNVGWYPTEKGEYTFEFGNCSKGQILQEVGGCHVKVVLFDNDHYNGDNFVGCHKIAEFDSKDYS